jgi:type VI secretion system secreted protein Hcp
MGMHRFIKATAALAAAGIMFVSSAALAANTVYVKVAGLQGESVVSGHAGDIEATSLSFSDKTSVALGTGMGAGKPIFSELTFTKPTDKSSPALFVDAATARNIGTVTITLVRSGPGVGGNGGTYMTITLTSAVVSGYSYAHDGTAGGTDTITLSYSKIQLSYAAGTSGSWNVQTNAAN